MIMGDICVEESVGEEEERWENVMWDEEDEVRGIGSEFGK